MSSGQHRSGRAATALLNCEDGSATHGEFFAIDKSLVSSAAFILLSSEWSWDAAPEGTRGFESDSDRTAVWPVGPSMVQEARRLGFLNEELMAPGEAGEVVPDGYLSCGSFIVQHHRLTPEGTPRVGGRGQPRAPKRQTRRRPAATANAQHMAAQMADMQRQIQELSAQAGPGPPDHHEEFGGQPFGGVGATFGSGLFSEVPFR